MIGFDGKNGEEEGCLFWHCSDCLLFDQFLERISTYYMDRNKTKRCENCIKYFKEEKREWSKFEKENEK
jgi:hypothetical protein